MIYRVKHMGLQMRGFLKIVLFHGLVVCFSAALFSGMLTAQEFVVDDGTNLTTREGPGTSYSKRGLLSEGTRLRELARKGDWSQVQTPDGETVWVHNGYIALVETESGLNELVPPSAEVRIITQTSHTSAIASISYSANGRYVVTNEQSSRNLEWLSRSNASKLWDIESGRLVSHLTGNEQYGSAEISKDGRYVAIFSELSGTYNGYQNYEIVSLGDNTSSTASGEPLPNFFSSDSKTIATVVNGDELVIRSVDDLQPIRQWALHTRTYSFDKFALSDDHQLLVTWSDIIAVPRVYQLDRPNEFAELEGPFGLVGDARYEFSPSGNYISSIDGFSNQFSVWDARTGARVRFAPGYGNAHVESLKWSLDDAWLAINFKDTSIVWDVQNGVKVAELDKSVLSATKRISGFSNDGTMFFSEGNSAVWKTTTGELVHQFHIMGWAAQVGSRILHFGRTGHISIYDLATFESAGDLGGKVVPVKHASWKQKNWITSTTIEEVLSGNVIKDRLKRMSVWNAGSISMQSAFDRRTLLNRFKVPPEHGDADDMFRWASQGGEVIISVATSPRLLSRKTYLSPAFRRILNGEVLEESIVLEDGRGGRQFKHIPNSNTVLGQTVIFGSGAEGTDEQVLRFWDTHTGKITKTITVGAYSENRNVDLAVSRNGKFVAAGVETSGKARFRVWDTRSMQEISDSLWDEDKHRIFAVSQDGKTGVAQVWGGQRGGLHLIDMESGRTKHRLVDPEAESTWITCVFCEGYQLADFSLSGRFLVTAADDGVPRVWNVETGKLVRTLKGHTAPAYAVSWSYDDKRIVTGSDDGSTRIWRAADGRELLRMYSFPDAEWIAITPEGFFNSSDNASKYLLAVQGVRSHSVDRFFNVLYRPDLVLEALRGDLEDKVRAAAEQMDLNRIWNSGLPPSVVALRTENIGTANSDRANVVAELEVRDGGVGRIEIRVNGATQIVENVPVGDNDGIKISQSVFLTPGENQIEVVAYNEANLIASAPLTTVTKSTAIPREKPTLHILAVGVNAYQDERIPSLNYAVSDAESVGEALSIAGAGVFEKVRLTTVRDAEATTQNLERVFSDIGSEARPEDVFVFFLSGHGKTQNGIYYFIPPDFVFEGDNPLVERGIGQDKWQRWMARVPAQKSVLLYDTCESGSVAREEYNGGIEVTGAIDRLTRATGRTILTAATDTDPALEGYGGHGVFSYLVLEAIGAGDADSDGQLEVTELASYIEAELPKVSFEAFQHRQVPQASVVGYSFSLGNPALVLGPGAQ